MDDLIIPLYDLRAKRRGYEVSVMKAIMDLLGMAGGPVRLPVAKLRPEELKSVQVTMDRWRAWISHKFIR